VWATELMVQLNWFYLRQRFHNVHPRTVRAPFKGATGHTKNSRKIFGRIEQNKVVREGKLQIMGAEEGTVGLP